MDTSPTSPNVPNPNVAGGSTPELRGPGRPDLAPTPGAEVMPAPGAAPGASQPAPVSPKPVVDPMALAMGQPAPMATAPSPAVGAPLPNVASDVDVIEPEWVDKADEVVRRYAGDPHGEEEAVEMLQEDYLKKRYGLIVKEPDADDVKPGPA